jgi:outer membrane protein insertion porin family
VNEIAPVVDAKYFHTSPFNKRHVIGVHVLGRWVTGYGGRVAPPFNRFYMGGENDIRGFDIWGISPIAYVPTSAQIPLYNNDGTARLQKGKDANGNPAFFPAAVTVPTYQLVFPGGDTQVVTNLEYRIPIFGPVTMALFLDAGANRLTRQSQLELNPDRVSTLNTQFPEAAFPNRAVIAGGTQKTRMSTGVEFQVLMPVVNAPFRVYWAYNPLRLDQFLVPPIVADRSYFPNAMSFFKAVAAVGQVQPFFEKASTFRFTVGRTF